MVLYGGADPGVTGALVEGELDLEWAGAIAPKASLTYVYGASAFTAMLYAIEANLAPIVSVSYGTCEVGVAAPAYEAIAQQANAQGITIVAASGDSGAAACDGQGFMPQATLGRSVLFPATLPEVTGIGGTQFAEGTGTYWAAANSSTFGSALSYIPESVWNESDGSGLGASGGGASRLYPETRVADGARSPGRWRARRSRRCVQRGGTRRVRVSIRGQQRVHRRHILRHAHLCGDRRVAQSISIEERRIRPRRGWATSIRNSTGLRKARRARFTILRPEVTW